MRIGAQGMRDLLARPATLRKIGTFCPARGLSGMRYVHAVVRARCFNDYSLRASNACRRPQTFSAVAWLYIVPRLGIM